MQRRELGQLHPAQPGAEVVLHHPLALLESPCLGRGLARLKPTIEELADRHPAGVGQAADPGVSAQAVEFVEHLLFCGAVDGPPLAPAASLYPRDRADPLSVAPLEDAAFPTPATRTLPLWPGSG